MADPYDRTTPPAEPLQAKLDKMSSRVWDVEQSVIGTRHMIEKEIAALNARVSHGIARQRFVVIVVLCAVVSALATFAWIGNLEDQLTYRVRICNVEARAQERHTLTIQQDHALCERICAHSPGYHENIAAACEWVDSYGTRSCSCRCSIAIDDPHTTAREQGVTIYATESR